MTDSSWDCITSNPLTEDEEAWEVDRDIHEKMKMTEEEEEGVKKERQKVNRSRSLGRLSWRDRKRRTFFKMQLKIISGAIFHGKWGGNQEKGKHKVKKSVHVKCQLKSQVSFPP